MGNPGLWASKCLHIIGCYWMYSGQSSHLPCPICILMSTKHKTAAPAKVARTLQWISCKFHSKMLSSNVHFSNRDAGSTGTLLPLSKFLHRKGFSGFSYCYWKGWGKQTKCKYKPYLSGLLPLPLLPQAQFQCLDAWTVFVGPLWSWQPSEKKTNLSLDVMVANKQHLFCYVLPSFSFMTGTLFEALDLRYLDSFTFKTMPLLCVAAWQCKVTLPPALQRKAPSAAGNFSTTPTFCAFSSLFINDVAPLHRIHECTSPAALAVSLRCATLRCGLSRPMCPAKAGGQNQQAGFGGCPSETQLKLQFTTGACRQDYILDTHYEHNICSDM